MNRACMICHYNEHPLEISNLERLVNILSSRVDESAIRSPKFYTWSTNNKCQYGMSCTKTHNYENKFRSVTHRLNYLLTAYVETTDCEDLYEILRYLQGYFPMVYRELEIDVRKKKKRQ